MSMAGRDGTDPDSTLPDSGMASGSDAGEPGGHLGPGDLAPDEERLLAALERDAGPARAVGRGVAGRRSAPPRTRRRCRPRAATRTTG